MADVTCVVNVHRESHLVTPTIKSVQRARKFASACGIDTILVLVLDKTDEDTRSVVCQQVEESDKVLEISKGDLALARNEAIKSAESEYVTFLDGDDLWCQTWIVDCFAKASRDGGDCVLHPEYNIYFGNDASHVLKHVDSESERFEFEYIYRQNYWTALSFSKRTVYERFPYKKNTILDGFGYEDWNWNYETLTAGIKHKTVTNTAHFIRRGKDEGSLLDRTNSGGAIPGVLEIYRKRPELIELSKAA